MSAHGPGVAAGLVVKAGLRVGSNSVRLSHRAADASFRSTASPSRASGRSCAPREAVAERFPKHGSCGFYPFTWYLMWPFREHLCDFLLV